MLWSAFFLSLLGAVLANEVTDWESLSRDMVDYINNQADTTWKAGENFKGVPLSSIKNLYGALETPSNARPPVRENVLRGLDLPKSYDPRKKWPNCTILTKIRHQGYCCGSCWAVSAASAMSDRICIASNGTANVYLSAEDLVSCCPSCGSCRGGQPHKAWDFFEYAGLVTGGEYKSQEGCLPYLHGACNNLTCAHKCRPGYNLSYIEDKHYGTNKYSINSNEDEIKAELMTRGPVTAVFTVYDDFDAYQSGVYQHVAGNKSGLHAVKMMGWGEENGTSYWLLANSWGTDWGDKGFFKILRGKNECGIESSLMAGKPRLDHPC